MIDFGGRSAIVTGAGRGIGGAISVAMADLGAAVALVDIDAEAVANTTANLESAGYNAHGYAGNILDTSFFAGVVDDVIARWGAVDVLVNNAGILRDNLVENIPEDDWDAVMDVNLKGAFLCTQAVVPHMKERGYGRIVNVASVAWLGKPGQANYAASKGGLVSLTRTLAFELARNGIAVNAVAPGMIETPLTQALPERILERLIELQPTKTMGSVEDVAHAVCFLASEAAGFLTGQLLHIDGGRSAGMLSL